MNWRRTGNDEYPEEGQKCLIYFNHTGFTISEFSWENYEDIDGNVMTDMGKISCFSSKHGWLGDEDLIWIPLKELEVPDSYKNDKKFKKWDDPEAIYRYVELIEDLHYQRNPENKRCYNQFDLDIPKGAKLGITSSRAWKNDGILSDKKYSEVWQAIYDDGKEKIQIYVASEQIKETS